MFYTHGPRPRRASGSSLLALIARSHRKYQFSLDWKDDLHPRRRSRRSDGNLGSWDGVAGIRVAAASYSNPGASYVLYSCAAIVLLAGSGIYLPFLPLESQSIG